MRRLSRREAVRKIAVIGGIGLAERLRSEEAPAAFSPEDDQILEDLERANYLYFWEQGNPKTGLVRDRFTVKGADHGGVASIAATGLGLTALCIADQRRYASTSQ